MTFEEARAQFPVLDRYAYLQAGSVGPLARGTLDAMLGEEEAGLRGSGERSRGSCDFSRLREALRGASPHSSASRPNTSR